MKPIENALPACGKTIADALQNAKDVVLGTHEKENQIAQQCILSENRVVSVCLDEISKGDSSPEREQRLWEQVNNALERQERICGVQIASYRESRGMMFAFGAFVVIGIVYVANPEAGNCFSRTLLAKAGKALIS